MCCHPPSWILALSAGRHWVFFLYGGRWGLQVLLDWPGELRTRSRDLSTDWVYEPRLSALLTKPWTGSECLGSLQHMKTICGKPLFLQTLIWSQLFDSCFWSSSHTPGEAALSSLCKDFTPTLTSPRAWSCFGPGLSRPASDGLQLLEWSYGRAFMREWVAMGREISNWGEVIARH